MEEGEEVLYHEGWRIPPHTYCKINKLKKKVIHTLHNKPGVMESFTVSEYSFRRREKLEDRITDPYTALLGSNKALNKRKCFRCA